VSFLLTFSRLIDRLSEFIGRWLSWLVLAAVLISAVNAVVRKAFDMSSNAFLEIQWYLFAAVFLLAAGYTLLRQEHVRIDVILHRFSRPTQVKIEIFGIVFFLFPFVFAVVDLVLPLVIRAYTSGEMSSNAGGLIRWPVFALLPLGFVLLGLQGGSELIKRIAFLRGQADDPGKKKQVKTAEEELAEAILAQAVGGNRK
jgi:TRAP-type mannitol/chloroaromatic compound transport system permease small subunit